MKLYLSDKKNTYPNKELTGFYAATIGNNNVRHTTMLCQREKNVEAMKMSKKFVSLYNFLHLH